MLWWLSGLVSPAGLPPASWLELWIWSASLWSNFGGRLAPCLGFLLFSLWGFLLLRAFQCGCDLFLHSLNLSTVPSACPTAHDSKETVSEILQDSVFLGTLILSVPLDSVFGLRQGCLHLVLAVREQLCELLLVEHKLLRGCNNVVNEPLLLFIVLYGLGMVLSCSSLFWLEVTLYPPEGTVLEEIF